MIQDFMIPIKHIAECIKLRQDEQESLLLVSRYPALPVMWQLFEKNTFLYFSQTYIFSISTFAFSLSRKFVAAVY